MSNNMSAGEIRIIGGQWRGRKLKVPEVPGLRPTPDRVRETLFNWLMPVIQGAYCLDPFAGSGALGFEALSRGAASVVMVDQSAIVTQLLQEELSRFKVDNAEVYRADVPQKLKKPSHTFDIVFLDPPYQQNLLLPTCFFLEENGFLSENAYLYLESKELLNESDLPAGWKILKSKKAGQVVYQLVCRAIVA
jgi:16S rRNA (guanine966-N2)-methyltransferase